MFIGVYVHCFIAFSDVSMYIDDDIYCFGGETLVGLHVVGVIIVFEFVTFMVIDIVVVGQPIPSVNNYICLTARWRNERSSVLIY